MELQDARVLIAGAGAAGGYLAARLIEKGVDTTVLTGVNRHEKIVCRALQVASAHGRFRKPVSALVAGQIGPVYDVVILACRAHLIEVAMAQVAPAVEASTTVLSLLDGGTHADVLHRIFPQARVMEGVLEGRLRIDADGIVTHAPPDVRIHLPRRHDDDALADRLAELLTGRGLVASATTGSDAARLAFARSIFLAAGIAASVLTEKPLRDALRTNTGAIHFGYALREGREIAAAEGVDVPKPMIERYRTALFSEGEPVASPPRVTDASGAGHEARWLLGRMVERASRTGVRAHSLQWAMARLTERNPEEVADVADAQ